MSSVTLYSKIINIISTEITTATIHDKGSTKCSERKTRNLQGKDAWNGAHCVKKDIIGLEASRAIIASVCDSTGKPIRQRPEKSQNWLHFSA